MVPLHLHLHFDGPTVTLTTPSVSPIATLSPLTPLSSVSGDMLRYCPSLEFSPSQVLLQSTALVLHGPEVLTDHTTAYGSDNGTEHAREQRAESLQPRLQSLVQIVREANASEQAAAPLETFLQQVRNQQETMEVALEKQTALAAAVFVESLFARASQDTDSASESSRDSFADSISDRFQFNHILTSPDVPKEAHQGAGRSKRAVTLQIQERLRTIQQGEEIQTVHENVIRIRKEIQKAYREYAGTSGRVDKTYIMELVLRHLLTPSSSIQSQQPILRRKLRTRLELIEDVNLEVLSFKAKGGLGRIIEQELRDVATSTKVRRLYSIEVLLNPCGICLAAPQNQIKTQVLLEQQQGHENKMQRCTADPKTMAHFTDAETQTPHNPVVSYHHESSAAKVTESNKACKTCKSSSSKTLLTDEVKVHLPSTSTAPPTNSKPAAPYVSLRLADTESKLPALETSPSVLKAAPNDNTIQQPVDSHGIGEQKLRDGLQELPKPKEEALEVSAKKTVTRIMACKREKKADNGPDHFLGLLDLVRKK